MDTFRKYVEKYLKLMRPKIVVLFLLPFTLGFAAAAEISDGMDGWRIACAYLSFFLCTFFESTLNFYYDVETDRLSSELYKDQDMSKQPFVTGEMGKVETPLLLAVSSLGGIGLAMLVNWWFAVFMAASLLIVGVFYNHPWFHFKARPVLDILNNSTGMGLLIIAGWKMAAPADVWPPVLPMVFCFIFLIIFYMPTVSNDAAFDEAAGYRTSAVVFGPKRLMDAMIPFDIALIVLGVLVLIGPSEWPLKLFAALAVPGSWVYTWAMYYFWDDEAKVTRFNAGLLIYPCLALLALYFVYALDTVLG